MNTSKNNVDDIGNEYEYGGISAEKFTKDNNTTTPLNNNENKTTITKNSVDQNNSVASLEHSSNASLKIENSNSEQIRDKNLGKDTINMSNTSNTSNPNSFQQRISQPNQTTSTVSPGPDGALSKTSILNPVGTSFFPASRKSRSSISILLDKARNQPPELIHLNVGGVHYNTLKATLLGYNLLWYFEQIESVNEDALTHQGKVLTAPPSLPMIKPTVFEDIFADIVGSSGTSSLLKSSNASGGNDTTNSNITPPCYTLIRSSSLSGAQEGTGPPPGVIFIDRDGLLFRYILDYLRTGQISLPLGFRDYGALLNEAKFYRLPHLEMQLAKDMDGIRRRGSSSITTPTVPNPGNIGFNRMSLSSGNEGLLPKYGGPGLNDTSMPSNMMNNPVTNINQGHSITSIADPGYITVGYRGTFAFGRDGQADVKFRKLTRILVCGRVSLCREVFGETLNESRDPDRGHYERYSSRFFLKHNFLEQAFDDLQRAGFRCEAACGTSTTSTCKVDLGKPSQDTEENKWNHYNEFIFSRPIGFTSHNSTTLN